MTEQSNVELLLTASAGEGAGAGAGACCSASSDISCLFRFMVSLSLSLSLCVCVVVEMCSQDFAVCSPRACSGWRPPCRAACFDFIWFLCGVGFTVVTLLGFGLTT